ncbi:unnamed protein product [Dracunculus medinensis]|uniref:Neur_chan_memb domain-containing protein n=1 Tax=Dracunculus medinensis TaxID=318479 RepID=A0A0N4UPX8_DRAME|nr:unnamed protein product [Dracunculus medinensis]
MNHLLKIIELVITVQSTVKVPSKYRQSTVIRRKQLTLDNYEGLSFFAILFLVLFAIFGKYTENATPASKADANFVNTNYPYY